jgi:hypothetical protein
MKARCVHLLRTALTCWLCSTGFPAQATSGVTNASKALNLGPSQTAPSQGESAPERSTASQLSPSEALSKALGLLRGSFNPTNSEGRIIIRAEENEIWSVTVENYPDVPKGGVVVRVHGTNVVSVTHIGDGESAKEWLTTARRAHPEPHAISPEFAFQKAFMFTQDRLKKVDFCDTRGRMTLSRTSKGDWHFNAFGYPNMSLSGCSVIVRPDATLRVAPTL